VVFSQSYPGQLGAELAGIFGAHALRFDGAEVAQRSKGAVSVFDVRYQFSLMKGKWWKQTVEAGTVWNRPMYEEADWRGKFPVGPFIP
jgi:hypothetical protein